MISDDPPLCEAPDTLDGTAEPDGGPETDIDETTAPETTPILSAPTNVLASTARTQDVELTWDAVPHAVGYRIVRCDGACSDEAWTPLNVTLVTEPRYLDTTAAAAAAPPAVELEASDDLYEHVLVMWDAVTAPAAPRYRYRVIALGGEEDESAPSAAVEGHRAERPVVGYEMRVGDGGWNLVVGGLVTSWTDTGAPAATLDPGTVNASQGTYAELVRLTVSGAVSSPGAARTYHVRAVTDYGPGPASDVAAGHRVAGALDYRWERSAAASEADFSTLSGATATSYDDTSAPSDGSTRYYRVVVSASGAVSATSAAVPGSRQPPPGLVGGVAASSDASAHVRVTWQTVSGALGYHVYRDGVKLTSGANGITATSYEDIGAEAPTVSWSAPSALVVSQNQTEHVALSWGAPPRPLGTLHSYYITAVNAAGESEPSAPASGRRAAPALMSYELASTAGGSTTYRDVGAVTSFHDASAPLATISGGTSGASKGDHRAHVKLTTSGGVVGVAPSVSYQVRGVLADGTKTPLSAAQSGRRATGALSRQWQRSSGTAPDGWSDIANCATTTCEDTAASELGEARWYRVALSASGAQTAYLAAVEGWRLAFVSVAAGGGVLWVNTASDTTCAVTPLVPDGGRVWCWGSNFANFLGPEYPSPPTRMAAFDQVVEVALGMRHGCARKADHSVWCWGENEFGQLGDGTTNTRVVPVRVGSLVANHIDAGGSATCAVLTTGQLWCWGDNALGQLGDNSTTSRTVPVQVRTGSSTFLTGVSRVGMSDVAGCAVKTDGTVWCWGSNSRGRLGRTTPTQSSVALQVPGLSGVGDLAMSGAHACARLGTTSARCWGANSYGQLGNGTTTDSPSPVVVSSLGAVAQISTGDRHSCARLTTGGVRCWGSNSSGQLGNGGTANTSVPVDVSSLGQATFVGTGPFHACRVDSAGGVGCWGSNLNGQLGGSGSGSVLPLAVVFP